MNWLIFSGAFTAIFLILCILLWREIRFHWKNVTFFCLGFLLAIFFLPITLRKPGSVENMFLLGRVIAYCLSWLGVEFELRGADYLSDVLEGAMWIVNHQHMVDNLGGFNCVAVAKRVAVTMKKELMYHPAGLAAKMYGTVFVDRHRASSAHNDINQWAHDAREQKFKVLIFPEGTRNFEAFKTQCLLPFKKGAFHAAVAAQIPILPAVISPYYFINYHERVFGRGKVIIDVLPPIPTHGLTKKDVPELINRVRNEMTQRYRSLSDEVYSSLPPDHPVFKWIDDVK